MPRRWRQISFNTGRRLRCTTHSCMSSSVGCCPTYAHFTNSHVVLNKWFIAMGITDSLTFRIFLSMHLEKLEEMPKLAKAWNLFFLKKAIKSNGLFFFPLKRRFHLSKCTFGLIVRMKKRYAEKRTRAICIFFLKKERRDNWDLPPLRRAKDILEQDHLGLCIATSIPREQGHRRTCRCGGKRPD